MAAYVVRIDAMIVCRSDTDPEELPADIYSRIVEHVHSDDDLLNLDIEVMQLPADLSGPTPH